MMDGSGGGGDKKPSSFSLTWAMLRHPQLPWRVAYLSIAMMALAVFALWFTAMKFDEKIAEMKAGAFQDCVDQMERLQPDIGAKYLALTCSPDGSLKALAWEAPGDL